MPLRVQLAPRGDIRYAAAMIANAAPIPTQPLTIFGPVGNLEALLDAPAAAPSLDVMAPDAVAVICHPHPLHGGTMTNKVAHMLAKSFNAVGVPAVRFNYRGVGASAGTFDEGNGETQDALAVLDWAAERWPGAELWLGGFSFGGGIAIRASVAREVTRLVTVAPAIRLVSVDPNASPTCPWLVVQGDRDELVDAADIQRWAEALAVPPRLAVLAGVDHFFHGRLNDLRQVVVSWLGETAESQSP